jgi:hypothetical protein
LRIYNPQNLWRQLASTAELFLSRHALAGTKGQIAVPSVFDVYEADFVRHNSDKNIRSFITTHWTKAMSTKYSKLFKAAYYCFV